MFVLWGKANSLFDTFQKSPLGKFILEKILFRSKGFISVFYTFVIMLVAQIASFSYVDEIIKFLDEKIAHPEYLPKIVWQILKIFAPEGNIWLIAVLVLATIGLWWIRKMELTIIKKPKELTGYEKQNVFVGRERELEIISKALESSSSLLLLNGIGGIGKTSLASYYLEIHKKEYQHYAFINGQNDIRLNLFQQFEKSLNLTKQENIEADFREVLGELRKLDGNTLLVIDDIKEVKKQSTYIDEILKLRDRRFKLLFTSRENINGINNYRLGVLDKQDAIALFVEYYPNDELDKVELIVKYLDYHTLFIELLAKTVKSEGYLLDEIIDKFEKGELSKIEFIDEEGEENSFNQNLKELFDLQQQSLKGEYILLLKQLAILPSIDIELSFLETVLPNDKLKGRLNFLVDKGWLIDFGSSYKLHQIIKEYILVTHTPSFEEIETVLDRFNALIDNSADPQVAVDNQTNIIYLESLATILDRLNIENEKVGCFFERFGNISYHLGGYKKALKYYQKALAIRKKVFGAEHLDTAITYNNLGLLYRSMGEHEKAFEYYQKSLVIKEKILGTEHPDTVTIYNNLGELYQSIGEHGKAFGYYIKALTIREKVLGIEHPDTAISYNNLGELYRSMREYERALEYCQKALEIREKVLGIEHPDTAISYNNLGGFYESMGEYEKALEYYQKALAIRKKVFGTEHQDTATTYNNLGLLYRSMGEHEKAYKFMKKAVEVRSKTLPPNHPHLISSKKWLKIIKSQME